MRLVPSLASWSTILLLIVCAFTFCIVIFCSLVMYIEYGCVLVFNHVEVFWPIGCGSVLYGVWGNGRIMCTSSCVLCKSLWLYMMRVMALWFFAGAILS